MRPDPRAARIITHPSLNISQDTDYCSGVGNVLLEGFRE